MRRREDLRLGLTGPGYLRSSAVSGGALTRLDRSSGKGLRWLELARWSGANASQTWRKKISPALEMCARVGFKAPATRLEALDGLPDHQSSEGVGLNCNHIVTGPPVSNQQPHLNVAAAGEQADPVSLSHPPGRAPSAFNKGVQSRAIYHTRGTPEARFFAVLAAITLVLLALL